MNLIWILIVMLPAGAGNPAKDLHTSHRFATKAACDAKIVDLKPDLEVINAIAKENGRQPIRMRCATSMKDMTA